MGKLKEVRKRLTEWNNWIRLFLDRLTKPLPRREMTCKLFKQTYAMKRMYVVNNKFGSN